VQYVVSRIKVVAVHIAAGLPVIVAAGPPVENNFIFGKTAMRFYLLEAADNIFLAIRSE